MARTTDRSLPVGKVVRPTQGWLRTTRVGLGLTFSELAGRLGITPPAVRSFEQAEAEDRITLASLRRTAAAMDCELIYMIVPRAEKIAGPSKRRTTQVEVSRTVSPPEPRGRVDAESIVTDLTRRTEYGEQ